LALAELTPQNGMKDNLLVVVLVVTISTDCRSEDLVIGIII